MLCANSIEYFFFNPDISADKAIYLTSTWVKSHLEKKMLSKKLIGGKQVKITSIPYLNALILNSETSKGSLKNIYCKAYTTQNLPF